MKAHAVCIGRRILKDGADNQLLIFRNARQAKVRSDTHLGETVRVVDIHIRRKTKVPRSQRAH